MLMLRQLRGVWYVYSSEYPRGHWAAYSDEYAARIFLGWLATEQFDCEGILRRMHENRLSPLDRKQVKWIDYAAQHSSRVRSKLEPVLNRLNRERRQVVKPA